MAPHKTQKNKKQQQHVSPSPTGGSPATSPTQESLPARPSLVTQSTETYEEAQENEREVLQAVFMDDYEESEATGAWSVSCCSLLRGDVDLAFSSNAMTQDNRLGLGANASAENHRPSAATEAEIFL